MRSIGIDRIRLAVVDMWNNKLRALLTMLGIAIGMGVVIRTRCEAVASRIETLGNNVVFVTPAPGTPFRLQQFPKPATAAAPPNSWVRLRGGIS